MRHTLLPLFWQNIKSIHSLLLILFRVAGAFQLTYPHYLHVVGQWEEARVPGVDPRKHDTERQQPDGGIELKTFCEVTVLNTMPLCCCENIKY